MKFYTLAACAALSLMMTSGCTTTTGSSNLQRDVDALKIEVADLKDNSRLADMRGGGATTADAAEISRLRTQVQRLSENVDSTGGMSGLSLRQQLDSISARLDRLEARSGLQPMGSTAGSSGTSPAGTSTAAANGYGGPSSSYRGPNESSPAVEPQPAAANPYEDGKSLFDKRQYRAAISQFESYLAADPKGGNAAAAQFYIGESLYAQKQYEEAILEYQKVVQNFPKSNHIPTSLLKQGLSFQSIGEKDSAKLLYQKVIRDYPKSYAAGVAKERMKTL